MSTPQDKIGRVRVGANHNIDSVVIGGQEVIGPWGIETADSWAFFTQEWGGYRHRILEQHGEQGDGFSRAEFVVKMREGKWRLKIDERWDENSITRSHELTCLEDSWFMDFVSRYVFKSSVFSFAEISGQTIAHEACYRNHQFPVQKARLLGKDLQVTIQVLKAAFPNKFKQVMYVRGGEGTWVVHVRLVPVAFDKEIIKKVKGVKMATPIPQFLARLLLTIPAVRKRLWYAGERGDWSSNYNGFGLVHLPEGTSIRLESKVEFSCIQP